MKPTPLTHGVALHVLNHLVAKCIPMKDGKYNRSDIEIALKEMEIPRSDANVDAVLAVQEIDGQMPHVEEGAARMYG